MLRMLHERISHNEQQIIKMNIKCQIFSIFLISQHKFHKPDQTKSEIWGYFASRERANREIFLVPVAQKYEASIT